MLSQRAVQKRASELKREEQARLEERTSRPRWQPEEYQTELGLRKLAIDPSTNKIILDLSRMMQSVFGFDPTKCVTQTEFIEREARMESETFDKAKAEGKHPNTGLCRMCRYVKPLQPKEGGDGWIWDLVAGFMPFGNWDQLSCRHSCSICRLILSCISKDELMNCLHPSLASVDPEVAGISLGLAILSTGETVLTLEYGMRPIGELRILTSSNYTQSLRQGWQAKVQSPEFPRVLEEKDGPVNAPENQRVDLIQLKQWLNNCDHNHRSVCNGYRGSGPRYTIDIPLTVIDVVDNCLVHTTSAAKYFTLSYVWGSVEMFKTLRANYVARAQKGGLGDLAPATIADAIALVRSLGERFLWVDALCIVQDDETHKQHDIKRMDVVYGKAFATVVAAHGASVGAGLPGVHLTRRMPQQIQSVTISGRSEELELDSDH